MLVFLLLLQVSLLSNVNTRDGKITLTADQLRGLDHYKHYLCGLSTPVTLQNPEGLFGWGCMKDSDCEPEGGLKITIDPHKDSLLTCDALRYNEDRDTCCLLTNYRNRLELGPGTDSAWDAYTFTKNTSPFHDLAELDLYREKWYDEFRRGDKEDIQKALREYEVCSVRPTDIYIGRTTYTPYICVSLQECARSRHHANVQVDIEFPYGHRWCAKSSEFAQSRPYCCHISTVIPLDRHVQSWNFVEFLPTQRYAPGFRAKIMCEHYVKLVCDGRADRCAHKVLHKRDYTVPGEFYHHALVGISLPRRQTFHCHGAIISKLFVLSSYDCRMQDFTLANVVLVGSFSFKQDEVPKKEQITYIQNHLSLHEEHWFLLLKLWRPLMLNPFVRPACIDWFSYNTNFSSKDFNFHQAWILGYGPQTKDGKFSTNVTRYNYDFNSTKPESPDDERKDCLLRVPDQYKDHFPKSWADVDHHICVSSDIIYSPYVIQTNPVDKKELTYHGFLSQGAPFSLFDRYCQWEVYGIYIQNERFMTEPPLLIETIPHALAWIENIVWKDFSLLSLNLSWPDCAEWEDMHLRERAGDPLEAAHVFNFKSEYFIYIKPEYTGYYRYHF